jgi:hypothetical protein
MPTIATSSLAVCLLCTHIPDDFHSSAVLGKTIISLINGKNSKMLEDSGILGRGKADWTWRCRNELERSRNGIWTKVHMELEFYIHTKETLLHRRKDSGTLSQDERCPSVVKLFAGSHGSMLVVSNSLREKPGT